MLEGSENPFGEIKVWKRLNIDRLFYFCMNGKYEAKKMIIYLASSALSLKKCAHLHFFIGNMPHIVFFLYQNLQTNCIA